MFLSASRLCERLWRTVAASVLALAPCVLLTADCAQADTSGVVLDDLAWMAGCWVGDEGAGRSEECWMPPAGGMMLGLHRDLAADGSLAGFEYLRIVADESGLAYLASPGGRSPTTFRLQEASAGRVVFSCPEHDFPQRIVYVLDSGMLHARVEGVVDDELHAMEWSWRPKGIAELTPSSS